MKSVARKSDVMFSWKKHNALPFSKYDFDSSTALNSLIQRSLICLANLTYLSTQN